MWLRGRMLAYHLQCPGFQPQHLKNLHQRRVSEGHMGSDQSESGAQVGGTEHTWQVLGSVFRSSKIKFCANIAYRMNQCGHTVPFFTRVIISPL